MPTAYHTYLALQKQANLFINAERSPLVAEKLLALRIAQAKTQGVVVSDAAEMHKWNPFRKQVDTAAQRFGGAFTARTERLPNVVKTLLGMDQPVRHRTDIAVAASLPTTARHTTLHHELDEADYMAQNGLSNPNIFKLLQNVHAKAKGLPQPHPNSMLEGGYGAIATPRQGGASTRAPIAHADPGVILREGNRVGHQLAPADAQQWVGLRRATGDSILMTAPYGKWMPEGGKEFRSQQRVMLSRNTPILSNQGNDARNMEALRKGLTVGAVGDMAPHKAYKAMKQFNKQYGKQLGKSPELNNNTVQLQAVTGQPG